MSEEKFERIKMLKDRLIGIVESQLSGDLSQVNAQELGEVMDMAKDCAELMRNCSESEYYCKITEAMEKNTDKENLGYMEQYLPESRFYDGMRNTIKPMYYGNGMPGRGRYYMYDDPMSMPYKGRMYYTEPMQQKYPRDNEGKTVNNNHWYNNYDENVRDIREGRAGITRRTYMEIKDDMTDTEKMQELDTYLHDLTDDIVEMIDDMDANSKEVIKGKINQLAAKIV